MPQLEKRHDLSAASLWEGRCPVEDCPMWFQIEADPGQPRWDVLKTFNQIRPRTRHLHGSFWVVDDIEQGGE